MTISEVVRNLPLLPANIKYWPIKLMANKKNRKNFISRTNLNEASKDNLRMAWQKLKLTQSFSAARFVLLVVSTTQKPCAMIQSRNL
jgi:hypothetical protein